jgi:sugar phosphate isomerase/epimerase
MRLCFDATRFGCGLDGAVELAAQRGLTAVEYSFQPFEVTQKAPSLDKSEKAYLAEVKKACRETGVEITCLNLDYAVDPEDKKEAKKFLQMLAKLVLVADAAGCARISVAVSVGAHGSWRDSVSDLLGQAQKITAKKNLRLTLRLSTPQEFRGHSLKSWRAMEPQDWREILSSCPDLSLSFSPADCVWLGIDYLKILSGLVAAIDHVEAHDIEINRTMLNDSGMYGPLWWRYRMPGKGQVDWRQLIELLKLYDFAGTVSIHLDDEFIGEEEEDLGNALSGSVKVLAPLVRD